MTSEECKLCAMSKRRRPVQTNDDHDEDDRHSFRYTYCIKLTEDEIKTSLKNRFRLTLENYNHDQRQILKVVVSEDVIDRVILSIFDETRYEHHRVCIGQYVCELDMMLKFILTNVSYSVSGREMKRLVTFNILIDKVLHTLIVIKEQRAFLSLVIR